MLVISRCPREITAPIDENIVVAERHVARGRWTTAELPFTIVCRRRVQRGVQHYDTTVADLQPKQRREEEEEDQNHGTFVDRVFKQLFHPATKYFHLRSATKISIFP